MQGSSHTRWQRVRTAVLFGTAFLVGAILVFGAATALGRALGLTGLSVPWRLGLAGTGLLAFAAVDLWSIRRSRYCPIGWRRQTPRALLRHRTIHAVAVTWGFDTGLAVTTFRVAAVTWGAILLTGLGLAPSWTGVAYALGFVAPFLVLVWTHPVGRVAHARDPSDPGLERMLGRRSRLQGLSAGLLTVGSAVVLFGMFAT